MQDIHGATRADMGGGPVRYRNPVIPGFYPDPSVCRVGEDFYLATSSFEYFPGVPLFHSRDLVNWTPVGHALTRPSQLKLDGVACSDGIFAPTLRWQAGRFYVVTTHVWGGGGNFYVWADDIRGPWSEPVWLDADWFDPSLFFDDDGRCYYTRRNGHAIVQSELDLKAGRLMGEPREIARPWVSLDGEGPHLYKVGGKYYLLTAEGGTGFGHMVCIGRSDTPWGPFEGCPANPILSHARQTTTRVRYTGHGDLVEAADGSWWMVFLATRHAPRNGACLHHLGRETFLAPVRWVEGWPVVNDGKLISVEMKVAHLPGGSTGSRPLAAEEPGAFDAGWPGPELAFVRNPEPGMWNVDERPGWLRLRGTAATLDDVGAPAFVGRRLDAPGFAATVRLECAPTGPAETAGLTLMLSNTFHAEVGVRGAAAGGGAREIFVRRRAGDLVMEAYAASWPEPGSVELAIEGDWQTIRFCAGGREVAQADRRFFCTEVAGGWTGCLVGMFVHGRGHHADFAAWTYRRVPLEEPPAYPWLPAV